MATQPDMLQDEIARRTGQGWVLVSREAAEAQMRKPKRFSILWFLAWTFLSLGTLFWVYLVWHWAKSDQLIFLRIVEGQVVATETGNLWGRLFAPFGAWWRWAGERESTQGKVLAYGGPVAAIVILIIIISVAASAGGGDDGEELAAGQPTEAESPTEPPQPADTALPPEPTNTPVPPTPIPEPTEVPPGPATTFGDGVHIVGVDIAPGTYRNDDSSGGCYWERLSGFGGDVIDDVITNEFSESLQIVTISPSDAGFSASDCGTWTGIGD